MTKTLEQVRIEATRDKRLSDLPWSGGEPKPKRAHRSPHGPGLYVTDLELIEELGVPEHVASQAIEMLDRDPKTGFPPKQKLWGNRRYLPAVRAWLDANNGLKMSPPEKQRAS